MQWLEKLYNKLSWFFSNCISLCISFIKILLKSSARSKMPIASLKKCIILGNGPSLKQSLTKHVDFISKNALVCVNSFALTAEYEQLKPAYYVMHDPGLWLSDSTLTKDIFEAIKTKTNWQLTLFIPRSARKSSYLKALNNLNEQVNIQFYNYTIYKGFQNIGHWLFKNNWAMPQCQNVLVACCFLCINLRFKEVYILGADHTWHQDILVDENNILCVKHIHFYDKQETVIAKPFYKGLHLKETFDMNEIFTAWAKVFIGYKLIRTYADYRNCKIYNASEVSFIDAFERVKI
jgi:hypothetical protein